MIVELNKITGVVVDTAYRIHEEVGPGLYESVYEAVLEDILISKGFGVRRQVPVPIRFGGKIYDEGFFADLIVEEQVIIEIKSVEHLARVHKKQLLTYLKLSEIPVGLLINFGGELLKGNIERLALPGAPLLPPYHP
jgi:GxxExxY protein